MALNSQGIEVPAGTDAFDPQVDLVELATTLEGRVHVPVANTTARATLATAVSPSASEPLLVVRADAGAGLEWEYSTNGTTWRTLTTDVPWTAATLATGWTTAMTVGYRVIDGMCELRGSAIHAAGFTGAAFVNLLTGVPASLAADGAYPKIAVGVGRIGSAPDAASAQINPRSDGIIRVHTSVAVGTNTVVTLDGARYRVS